MAEDHASGDQITITAQCLCKAHTFTADVPRSSLPLKASACHCNSCRHVTGALYSFDMPWPADPSSVDLSGLKTYAFSDRLSLHFCGTCSTPMFFGHPGAKPPNCELGVFTGTLKNEPQGNVLNITGNIYVGDTKDGGLTPLLRHANADGTEAPCWRALAGPEDPTAEQLPSSWPPSSALTGYEAKREDKIPIRCKCSGVNLLIHRFDPASSTATPDLPWFTHPKEPTSNPDIPWFVDAKTHKYVAGNCVCDSCRLFAGIDIFNWTFAALDSITDAEGRPLAKDTAGLAKVVDAKEPSIGTLAYYRSSPDVQRYFCSNCSASVFFACDQRNWMVDVAVGMLDASDGARAEGMLAWRFDGMDFIEDTKGGWREGMIEAAKRAGAKWREERGYPKV